MSDNKELKEIASHLRRLNKKLDDLINILIESRKNLSEANSLPIQEDDNSEHDTTSI